MDNRQYRQIVDDYADMVYRIALNQTRRVPDAEDVVQAVFLKLYEKPPAWLCDKAERDSGRAMAAEAERGAACDERLRAWLIRVTVNECKSLWRSLWRQRVELREIRDGDAPPFEEPAFAEPAHEALYAALGTLPEKCRIVVHLFYFEDMGTREIAEVLGIKEPTVRTRLVRARKLLKQSLKEAWEDEQLKPVQSHDGRGADASADLIGKVKGIPMEKTKKRTTALKFATATCAALLGVFVVTNGVCYAATGETWVEKATVYINGEPVELDVQMSQNGDTTVAEVSYEVNDESGGAAQMTMISEDGDFDGTTFEIHDYTVEGAEDGSPNADDMVLESSDGHVILAPEGIEPIDLTDELATNGAATGTYEKDGATYVYQVSGEPGNWHASVHLEGVDAAPSAAAEAR